MPINYEVQQDFENPLMEDDDESLDDFLRRERLQVQKEELDDIQRQLASISNVTCNPDEWTTLSTAYINTPNTTRAELVYRPDQSSGLSHSHVTSATFEIASSSAQAISSRISSLDATVAEATSSYYTLSEVIERLADRVDRLESVSSTRPTQINSITEVVNG